MMSTEDGEFYPEKNLDKSYRIPRSDLHSNKANSNMAGRGGPFATQNETPLADSYYNYPYDPRAAGSYYQPNYQQFGNNRHASMLKGGFNFAAVPPPPPPPSSTIGAPLNKSIYDTLQQIKEKPKNYGRNIYKNNSGNNKQGTWGYGNQDFNDGGNNGRFGNDNGGNENRRFSNENFGKQPYQALNNKPRFQNNRFNNEFNESNGIFNNHNFKRKFNQFANNDFQNNWQNNFNESQRFNREKPQWPKKKKLPPAVNLTVHEIVPDLQDNTLPKDLKLLFQPLFCKLCSIQLSSNQTAKMHYKSKNHEKKIRKWLVEHAEKTGETLHPRAQSVGEKKAEDGEKDPRWYHCEVCDLQLTGQLHAESHYMGRNHQKALLGRRTPAGQGYYDKDGKWVRIKSVKQSSFNFEGGGDNFGMAFKTQKNDTTIGGPPTKKMKKEIDPQQFHCDVCNINTTCDEQLQNHYKGQKHAKKLKGMGIGAFGDQRKLVEKLVIPESGSTVVEVLNPSVVALPVVNPDDDLSVYRTPSGSFYCPSCNLTTNSKQQFVQHMNSKNHARKATQPTANGK
ncbi:uncharacterized protein [Euwallacea fornicatus]|uniref:uncharacterized protein isoform X1 n=1 Tax=Euwallacea fornicatus TaxID=995702 RepID=UPI0033900C94